MKEQIFSEIGFGNKTFISTEIEKGKKEHRINEFILPKKIKGVYLGIWILKKVFILFSCEGIKFKKKDKNKFKFLFGIQGEED